MQDIKVDPRTVRTRKLLMDSFLEIIKKKEFKGVTIKDITEEATVNRATFYSHFQDKYDLMDAAITEDILEGILKHLNHYDQLNEQTVVEIFSALTEFHTKKNRDYGIKCKRSYESFHVIIEQKIKKELGELFYSLFLKQHPNLDLEALKIGANMLSWEIYGASLDWQKNSSLSAEQYAQKALPFIVTKINNLKG